MITPKQRKQKSIDFLRSAGITTTSDLPSIQSLENASLRPASEVAKRAICLVVVSDFGKGYADDGYHEYIRSNAIEKWFTRDEFKFIKNPLPIEEIKINMSWRIESAFLLLWALDKIKDLPIPFEESDTNKIFECLPSFKEAPRTLIHDAKLIEKEIILNQFDLIYRMHDLVRNPDSFENTTSSTLHPDVVQEWFHAIKWLTGHAEEEWDDIIM